MVDISNPENPDIGGSASLAWANSLEISGHHAYVTGRYSGLSLIDITNSENPEVVCSGAQGWAGGVALSDNHAFVVGEYGLQILPMHCDDIVGITEDYLDPEPTEVPKPIAQLSVHPNPFNPRTTISFSIDHPQNVQLAIYDMTGKRIAVLADRTFETGAHSMDWQGKDLQGRAVASGTYLLRMITEERVTSEKMMLVR